MPLLLLLKEGDKWADSNYAPTVIKRCLMVLYITQPKQRSMASTIQFLLLCSAPLGGLRLENGKSTFRLDEQMKDAFKICSSETDSVNVCVLFILRSWHFTLDISRGSFQFQECATYANIIFGWFLVSVHMVSAIVRHRHRQSHHMLWNVILKVTYETVPTVLV